MIVDYSRLTPAVAKRFLLRLALSHLRYARTLSAGYAKENRANRLLAQENRELGLTYARESRRFKNGPISTDGIELPCWEQATNPHWPDLPSHGVYVALHEYHGSKKPGWCLEVQILPPDKHRSQCCFNKPFRDHARAVQVGKEWVAIGREIISAV